MICDIEGYKGIYSIDENGVVRNMKRNNTIKSQYLRNGYLSVMLSKQGQKTNFTIHRLLCQHFIPNPENKPQVNHIDGNKQNNSLSNLEWCTALENTRHSIEKGLSRRNGSNNSFSKLTDEQVIEIRSLRANQNLTFKELSEKFNISLSLANKIVNRVYWKHI